MGKLTISMAISRYVYQPHSPWSNPLFFPQLQPAAPDFGQASAIAAALGGEGRKAATSGLETKLWEITMFNR